MASDAGCVLRFILPNFGVQRAVQQQQLPYRVSRSGYGSGQQVARGRCTSLASPGMPRDTNYTPRISRCSRLGAASVQNPSSIFRRMRTAHFRPARPVGVAAPALTTDPDQKAPPVTLAWTGKPGSNWGSGAAEATEARLRGAKPSGRNTGVIPSGPGTAVDDRGARPMGLTVIGIGTPIGRGLPAPTPGAVLTQTPIAPTINSYPQRCRSSASVRLSEAAYHHSS